MNSYIKFSAVLVLLAFASISAHAAATPTNTNLGNLTVPGSYNYNNTFTAPTPAGNGFVDNWIFTIANASADSVASTISLGSLLGLDSLSASFYSWSGTNTQGAAIETASVLSLVNGGTTATLLSLNPVTLNAGTYALQISGNAVGTIGGSYSGILNLAPVPEPDTYGMLLAGLGLMGFMIRRGSAKQA